ncbi:hypothetical protein SAMN05216359_1123 [Roseateles sp. YR242]|uniref:hypothetical protein n=1 Tax=Roseateles sp. YR242 TaxID=1855305 RepID=UPI0008D4FD34|nr:hypothetical protein [Roseateles sp. YR242]SEL60169.1 hypothetical protein SAMN05216359_1123 [Roseateles sp. YR242]
MNTEALAKASKLIAARNVNSRVKSVKVGWDAVTSKLTVAYYIDREPSEEEIELCELSMGELLAEFPEVITADTKCVDALADDDSIVLPGVVYTRD